MSAPAYYCPPGVDRPAHIRAVAPNQLVAGAGPDQAGGSTYGRAYDADDAYHRAPGGWWVCLTGCAPRDLARASAVPGYVVGDWLVPQILRADGLGTAAVGYWTADGFRVPDRLEPIVHALRDLLDYQGPVEAKHAQLAAEILAVNYHVSLVELGLMAVLTNSAAWAIIMAAAGIPPEAPSRG